MKQKSSQTALISLDGFAVVVTLAGYAVAGTTQGLVVVGSVLVALVATAISARIGAIASMIAGLIMMGWS